MSDGNGEVTGQGILELVIHHVAAVLDVRRTQLTAATRFDDDLHADSLDLLEVVEVVERELGRRGLTARISDDEFAELRTVGEVAERVAAAARPVERRDRAARQRR